MSLLQLQLVAGEWQSNTTVGGDDIYHLCSRALKAGGLEALFSSPSIFKKIEPPSKNQEVSH